MHPVNVIYMIIQMAGRQMMKTTSKSTVADKKTRIFTMKMIYITVTSGKGTPSGGMGIRNRTKKSLITKKRKMRTTSKMNMVKMMIQAGRMRKTLRKKKKTLKSTRTRVSWRGTSEMSMVKPERKQRQ